MVKVAIIGVGNVASALLQSLEMVKNGSKVQGIREDLPLSPCDIEIVSAFDVDKRKVGLPLSRAIFERPNVVEPLAHVRDWDVMVKRGPTLDGREGVLGEIIEESEDKPVDVTEEIRQSGAEVVLNLLPTGADKASIYYAQRSLEAGSSFINATPSPLTRLLGDKFVEAGLPLLGDDLLSQIGGTAFHAGLIDFLKSRGVKVTRSYQIDIAGTTEALVTLEDKRKDLKKGIKSSFLSSHSDADVVAGTSDYVEFLRDKRVSYMVIEGTYSIGVPIRVDISLKTMDAPNAVAPLIDLIRYSKMLKDNNMGGPIKEVCGYYFKNSIDKYNSFEEAKLALDKFTKSLMREPRTE
ncbi:inositol-3-phosphate synthase [Sulfuracidifex metallicus]|uniref:inositol-3-phosphate synthase n=1 Tax=Sulfuracidifex metallicus TaxID=47303 RepID=UPI002272DB4C|nr:L-myo-inositol-1-phosphate synthase [Sulfuracidifex metallicus]MCY0850599.1 L-myo-inositol-1-phosphate synthase [Sulfuracidifex metallicus]